MEHKKDNGFCYFQIQKPVDWSQRYSKKGNLDQNRHKSSSSRHFLFVFQLTPDFPQTYFAELLIKSINQSHRWSNSKQRWSCRSASHTEMLWSWDSQLLSSSGVITFYGSMKWNATPFIDWSLESTTLNDYTVHRCGIVPGNELPNLKKTNHQLVIVSVYSGVANREQWRSQFPRCQKTPYHGRKIVFFCRPSFPHLSVTIVHSTIFVHGSFGAGIDSEDSTGCPLMLYPANHIIYTNFCWYDVFTRMDLTFGFWFTQQERAQSIFLSNPLRYSLSTFPIYQTRHFITIHREKSSRNPVALW
jgi:hypothetical protein